MLISGMYDLEPVRLSKRSAYVKFTDEMEQALSAMRHHRRPDDAALFAHGTCETPEFLRQTREFFAAVKAAGKPAELIVGENYNHFEIFETFANPYGLLGRAVLRQMKLHKSKIRLQPFEPGRLTAQVWGSRRLTQCNRLVTYFVTTWLH